MKSLLKCMRLTGFSCFLFLSCAVSSSESILIKSNVVISGTVSNKSCSISIASQNGKSSVIDFGVYNKSARNRIASQNFSILVFEEGKSTPGCDALSTGSSGLVKLKFGNNDGTQLDNVGVITTGSGDQVHIHVQSNDGANASSIKPITSSHNILSYQSSFAQLGVFKFQATPIGLENAKVGNYTGALSVSVTYE